MKIVFILVMILMLIPLGIASYKDPSYKDITPDDIIAGRNHTTINKTINESDPIDWYNEGDALFNSGQYNESIEAYNRAIELNKSYTEAWIGEGFALDILGQHGEAIKAYDRAIEINSQYAPAWINKGNALEELDKYDEAARAFEEAKRLDPKNYGMWNATDYKLSHSPDWMEIAASTEDHGIDCYIILHNKAGAMIRADGTLRIEIYEVDPATKLWSKLYSVKATDFVDTTAELSSLANSSIIWNIDRISYDKIKSGLGNPSSKNIVTLEIRAYFDTNDGRTLENKTTQYVS